jgi:hypothetical protein
MNYMRASGGSDVGEDSAGYASFGALRSRLVSRHRREEDWFRRFGTWFRRFGTKSRRRPAASGKLDYSLRRRDDEEAAHPALPRNINDSGHQGRGHRPPDFGSVRRAAGDQAAHHVRVRLHRRISIEVARLKRAQPQPIRDESRNLECRHCRACARPRYRITTTLSRWGVSCHYPCAVMPAALPSNASDRNASRALGDL